LADRITTFDKETITGLVNVNAAPKEVLLCLPGLEAGDVEALLARRSSGEELGSIAWVAGVLDREKAVAVGGHITTRSFQYSADIIGVAQNGRAYRRYKAVFDTCDNAPRILYWKSLTHLGWPLDSGVLEKLRSGRTLASTVLGTSR
ncbi:MAG: hypothetical protein ACYTBJ_13005, partial [Planctomycetota bacterium]